MAEGSHVGRPSSWMAVSVMLVGFILGGIGLVAGPSWPFFWAGVAIAAIGGVLALAVGIFSDVITYTPRDIAVSADGTANALGVSGAADTEIGAGTTKTTPAPREAATAADAENPENPQSAENLASG